MKVIEILKNLDYICKVKILEAGSGTLSDDVCFEGEVLDVPWCYAEMYVDTTENGEGLFVDIDKESRQPYLGIYVREEE